MCEGPGTSEISWKSSKMPICNNNLRLLVGLCFVGLYLLVGVPLWYNLTAVYRAPLPVEYIRSLHEQKFHDVHMVIPVYIKSIVYRFPDVHEAVQVQVNHLLNSRYQFVPWSLQVLPHSEMKGPESENHVISLVLDDFVGYSISYSSKETTVFFDDRSVISNDVPFFVAQTIIEHTFTLELEQLSSDFSRKHETTAISYNPNIHLSVSLLTGDGYPISWEIDSALKEYFTPLRKLLSPLVNFTVDTGITYYNDLNLHILNESQSVTEQGISHAIDLSELSSMNYFEEPVSLNLAIIFPSELTAPSGLQFINNNSTPEDYGNNWKSYVVPQWGVFVINKYPLQRDSKLTGSFLVPIMYQFANDLFQLLGLAKNSGDITHPGVTIDSFKRWTTLRNINKAEETLWSLVKLANSFEQMSIPHEVLTNTTAALDLRLDIIDLLNDPKKGGDLLWNQALALSNQLVKLSETAFFHSEMVQQNFFPQEHKIAVYLPLLGPSSVVIFFGFIKLMKERNQNAKAENEKEDKDSQKSEPSNSTEK